LRIEFSDGKTTEVDFEPFLRAATHPAIVGTSNRAASRNSPSLTACFNGTISTSSSRWPISTTA